MIHTLLICIAVALFIAAVPANNARIAWAGLAVFATSFLPL